ncbi:Creatinine amidohydrolase [Minicystis rosea]|nr:Creatinine amidohydrolase [Minicystis rosea]
MMDPVRANLAYLTTERLREALAAGRPTAALVPVGSVEPHGPHLPLATDTIISEAAAMRAAEHLEGKGVVAFVAPAVPYGVTDFAAGFAGAISVPAEVLTAFLRAVVRGYLDAGFAHVCLVNNHLEPAHDTAVRGALAELAEGLASVACPLTRRWGRTLSAEFKSGACHAGEYETSLVLAAQPEAVDWPAATALPDVTVSLSEGIKAGKNSFSAMGLERAYTGAPARATAAQGEEMLALLATMIATEVLEGLAKKGR